MLCVAAALLFCCETVGMQVCVYTTLHLMNLKLFPESAKQQRCDTKRECVSGTYLCVLKLVIGIQFIILSGRRGGN